MLLAVLCVLCVVWRMVRQVGNCLCGGRKDRKESLESVGSSIYTGKAASLEPGILSDGEEEYHHGETKHVTFEEEV